MPTFSIIIPFYNAEETLERCLDSLRAQTYPHWEAICIDDGSTDTSSHVAKKFTASDSRFFLNIQKNTGVSAARNKALSIVKGKYILFLDADDTLEPHALDEILNSLGEQSSILGNFAHYYIDTKTNQTEARYLTHSNRGKHITFPINYTGLTSITSLACDKVYCRDLIVKHNLQFDIKVKIGEDLKFILHYLLYCDNIHIIDIPLYNYFWGNGATGDVTRIAQKYTKDELQAIYDALVPLISMYNAHSEAVNFKSALCYWSWGHRNYIRYVLKHRCTEDTKAIIKGSEHSEQALLQKVPILQAINLFFRRHHHAETLRWLWSIPYRIITKLKATKMGMCNNIAIVTHPLESNYGGILQAYALQKTLHTLGCSNVSILRYKKKNTESSLIREVFYMIRTLFFQREKTVHHDFIKKHFKFTDAIISSKGKIEVNHPITSFIVGSDQVWRKEYVKYYAYLQFYFLDSATSSQRSKSIAYAASFGSDRWEGNTTETFECAKLLKDFYAVSVREKSGIELCKKHFGVEANLMPDPTMLLTREEYDELIAKGDTNLPTPSRFIAVYILDLTQEKQTLINQVALEMNLPVVFLNSKTSPLTIPNWLLHIKQCDYFITDSFHGSVFSIIYGKSFVCLGNKDRGNSRFTTLLDTYDLTNKLISDYDIEEVLYILNNKLSEQKIQDIINNRRSEAFKFINNYINTL